MPDNEPKSPCRLMMLLSSYQVGGMEMQAFALAKAIKEQGFESLFCAFGGDGPMRETLAAKGFTCLNPAKSNGLDPGLPWRLAGICKQHSVDLLHAHNWYAGFYAACSRIFHKTPVVTTLHGFAHQVNSRRMLLRGIGARFSGCTVCVGDVIRQEAIKRHRLNPHKTKVIYNGVDIQAFSSAAAQREKMRIELGIEPDETVFIFVGRISAIKALPTLISSSSLLANGGEAHRLLIAGGGEGLPGIKHMARELKASGHIDFLGERSDISALLGAADAFVIPSLSEGISMAILEAMAAGLPVIASAVGGNPELVQEDLTGYLVPAQDPQSLCQAMQRIIQHPRAAQEMGSYARQIATDKYSQSRMAADYIHIYRKLINR